MASSSKLMWLVLLLCLCYCSRIDAKKRNKNSKKGKSKDEEKLELAMREGLRFDHPVYAADIREDIPVGTVVATVRASSSNEGKSFYIRYIFQPFCRL